MKTLRVLALLFVLVWLGCPPIAPSSAASGAVQIIYDDQLAQGWENWSWAQVNLSASAPVHGGLSSIAVSMDAWEGLYLHKAGVDTSGLTHLRFYLHGGTSGGQDLILFMNLEGPGGAANGPGMGLPTPTASAWIEVLVPLVDLNPDGYTITGLTWQEASGGSQPTWYLDDLSLISQEHPDAPQLTLGRVFPRALPPDPGSSLVVRVRVADPQSAGDVAAVQLDARALGLGWVPLSDDGRSSDGSAGDGMYGAAMTLPAGTAPGEARLLVQASDQAGHSAALPLGSLVVLGPVSAPTPPALPARLGWGSNAWSETAGQDWQVNSGVPWDYVYQYITYGWQSWGGSFVQRFVQQAWDKNYIPVVTVYLMLGTPPECGEGGACYAQKLQQAGAVQAYLASFEEAVQEAAGSRSVIFNLEPDFYGFMQQLSNSAGRPAGVIPDDPASYPVALNKPGYANNLAGFGRYLVDRLHALAPNALAAPMASAWATNGDPQSVTPGEAAVMAQRTAAFIAQMGGAQADLLVTEWSDRDAGSGMRPWWDDRDFETPRPTRAILWANALSRAAGRRLLLWQVPVGNMALDNTCDHYQDNRAAYAFSHPRELFEAGIAGVLFGGGASCMTQVWTDGGFAAAQAAVAYTPPGAPTGLVALTPVGAVASLRWDDNPEPDLWGYQVQYRPQGSGAWQTVEAGRRTSLSLLLPGTGAWELRLLAVDAMASPSLPGAAVTVTVSAEVARLYLPLVGR